MFCICYKYFFPFFCSYRGWTRWVLQKWDLLNQQSFLLFFLWVLFKFKGSLQRDLVSLKQSGIDRKKEKKKMFNVNSNELWIEIKSQSRKFHYKTTSNTSLQSSFHINTSTHLWNHGMLNIIWIKESIKANATDENK